MEEELAKLIELLKEPHKGDLDSFIRTWHLMKASTFHLTATILESFLKACKGNGNSDDGLTDIFTLRGIGEGRNSISISCKAVR